MNDWIARYVQAVIARLPENERTDVKQELTSNIYDMLPDDPSEEEIKSVLLKMGPPAALAEEYRQEPKYLISPRVYNDYIQVLKYLVPTVGGIVAIIGGVIGGIEGANSDVATMTQKIIQQGLSMGLSAAFQATLWTTIGFVIAERQHAFSPKTNEMKWQLEDLPQLSPGRKIPVSDSIAEMAMTLFFSVMVLLVAFNQLPFVIIRGKNGLDDLPLFGQSFIWKLVPVLVLGMLMSVLVNSIKLKDRRWTKRVLQWTLFENVISSLLWIILLIQPDFFSQTFINFLQKQEWAKLDVLHSISGETSGIIVTLCLIIGAIALAECGNALYQYYRKENLPNTLK